MRPKKREKTIDAYIEGDSCNHSIYGDLQSFSSAVALFAT